MTRHLDVDRTLESWLAEGPSNLPDHVIDGIVRQLDEKDQRRSVWLPRRQQMNRMILAISGVAAAVALAFVAVGLYFNGPGVAAPPQPTEPPRATSQPTAVPTVSPTPEATQFPPDGEVEPGRYQVDVGLDDDRFTLTVPAVGWNSYNGFLLKDVVDPLRVPISAEGASFGIWDADSTTNVYADPCAWSGTELNPPPGPTAADLATALATQDGWDTSEPTDVTVDGYPGKQLRLTVPQDVEFAFCRSGEFRSWGDRWYQHPGQIEDLWILDVDGSRYIVMASYFPQTPEQTQEELRQIVDSLEIESEDR